MYIDKTTKRRVAANRSVKNRRPIRAAEEDEMIEDVSYEDTDLLFEAEDVAQLLAEVTGEAIDVTVNDDGESVIFSVGDEEYTVEAEGDEEVLESCRRSIRGKKSVKASTNCPAGRRFARRK